MAEAQNEQYQSPFTADAIMELTDHLKASLKEYAEKKGQNIDYFVLLASLGQTAFELSYSSLLRTPEERETAQKECKTIVDGLLAKLDGVRAEYKTKLYSDILASTQFMSLLAEIYCRRRDQAIVNLLADKQKQNNEQEKAQE